MDDYLRLVWSAANRDEAGIMRVSVTDVAPACGSCLCRRPTRHIESLRSGLLEWFWASALVGLDVLASAFLSATPISCSPKQL